MATNFMTRVVDWLREGYPSGIPPQDTIPVLALLRRRLTDEQVQQIADELRAQGLLSPDRVEVGTAITRITDEMPSESDTQRVFDHLAFRGFPDSGEADRDADGPAQQAG